MLWILLSRFADICLLRRSPAELPASTVLAVLTSATIFLLSSASEWLGQPPRHFPEWPLVSLTASFLVVATVVRLGGQPARLKQTWIALTGCGALISIPMFMLALSVSTPADEPGGQFPLTVLTMAFLLVWSIVVDAHIYRHALGVGLSAGMAIATLSYALMVVMRTTLFP